LGASRPSRDEKAVNEECHLGHSRGASTLGFLENLGLLHRDKRHSKLAGRLLGRLKIMRGEGFCGEGQCGNKTAALIKGDGWGGGGRGRAAHIGTRSNSHAQKRIDRRDFVFSVFEPPVWAFNGGHWRQKKLIFVFVRSDHTIGAAAAAHRLAWTRRRSCKFVGSYGRSTLIIFVFAVFCAPPAVGSVQSEGAWPVSRPGHALKKRGEISKCRFCARCFVNPNELL